MDIYANGVKNVDIECIAEEDCYYVDFYLNSVKNVNIDFNGRYSGYRSKIFTQNVTNSVNILCDGVYSCYDVDLYCPYSVYGMLHIFLCIISSLSKT